MKNLFFPPPGSDAHNVRPFFIFLTAVVLGMYIWSLAASPFLREPLHLVVFTTLVFIHLLFHWSIFLTFNRFPLHLFYFVGQGLLALVIGQYSANNGMALGLYMALVGEAVGALQGHKYWAIVIIVYNVLLSLLGYGLSDGWENIYWALLAVVPMSVFVVTYVALYNRQSDARERAQALAAELEAANRQLSDYAARVEDLTIANERQRMARELHDTLSQGLAGLILQLEAVDAHLAGSRPEKARSIVANAMEQARATLADARRAIDDLRHESLENLEAALRYEVSRFTNATGIPCDFHADPTPPIPDTVRETMVRAVAEGLTNVARHARAHWAEVHIEVSGNKLQGTVRDDGDGFDPVAVPTGHYGLVGIRERVRLVGGTFEISSAPGQGTTLKVEVPL